MGRTSSSVLEAMGCGELLPCIPAGRSATDSRGSTEAGMVTRMPPVKRLLFPALTLLLLRAVPSCSSSDGATDAPPDLRLRDVPEIFASKACEVTLDCLGPVAD